MIENISSANLFSLFQSNFPSDGNELVIDALDRGTYTYRQLDSLSAKYANTLRHFNVKPGDRILVQVEKSPEAIFLYLGCLRTGVIYIPLNAGYKKSELEYFLEDASPLMVISGSKSPFITEGLVKSYGALTLTLESDGSGSLQEATIEQDVVFDTLGVASNDIAAILYTSGTTGKPKGAMLTHGNLSSNALALKEAWEFNETDVLLHALPIFHTHGLFVGVSCVLASGASMLFLPRFEVEKVLSLLPCSTVMMGVPTFYTRLLESGKINAEICKKTRLFISGSAPLLEQTWNEFCDSTGHKILERYGMTETCMNTSNPLIGSRKPTTVGIALPGVEVRVTGDNDQPLAAGEVGNIEVQGPNVFKGYWQNPEKTKEEFTSDGFFMTGDIGVISDDGYLSIVGRSKDLIISGGFNVYPKEVESIIDRMDTVLESAVIGVSHADFGEAVVAVIVLESGVAEMFDAQQMTRCLKEDLAAYKVPKKIVVVDELPRNVMGKVQKKILREIYSDVFSG